MSGGTKAKISPPPSLGSDSADVMAELRRRQILESIFDAVKVYYPDVDALKAQETPLIAVREKDRRSVEIANEQHQDVEDGNAAMERHNREYMMAELKWRHRTADDEELLRKYPHEVVAVQKWEMPGEQREVPTKAIHALKVAGKNALPWLFKKFALGSRTVQKGEVLLERDDGN